jgi:hypothetical protein
MERDLGVGLLTSFDVKYSLPGRLLGASLEMYMLSLYYSNCPSVSCWLGWIDSVI